MSQLGFMPRSSDRHKPSRQMRISEAIAKQLDLLAERNATTAPQEANRIIREALETLGLWPPVSHSKSRDRSH